MAPVTWKAGGTQEMKTVDDYERIRKAYYVEGLSIRRVPISWVMIFLLSSEQREKGKKFPVAC